MEGGAETRLNYELPAPQIWHFHSTKRFGNWGVGRCSGHGFGEIVQFLQTQTRGFSLSILIGAAAQARRFPSGRRGRAAHRARREPFGRGWNRAKVLGRLGQVDPAGPPPSGNTQAPHLPRPESRRGAEPGHAQGAPKIWDVEDAALARPAARGTREPSRACSRRPRPAPPPPLSRPLPRLPPPRRAPPSWAPGGARPTSGVRAGA